MTLFAAFGCVCGFYVSVVGFTVTSLGIALLVGLGNSFASGPFTLGFLVLGFVAMQVGYGLAVVGRGFINRPRRPGGQTEVPRREIEPDHKTAVHHGQASQGPARR